MTTLEKILNPMKEMGTSYMKGATILQKSMLRAQAELHKGWLAMVEETIKDLDHSQHDAKKKSEKSTIM